MKDQALNENNQSLKQLHFFEKCLEHPINL
jgi:hypothetical protein